MLKTPNTEFYYSKIAIFLFFSSLKFSPIEINSRGPMSNEEEITKLFTELNKLVTEQDHETILEVVEKSKNLSSYLPFSFKIKFTRCQSTTSKSYWIDS